MFDTKGKINIVLENDAICPSRAHENDAGLDLYARNDAEIPAGGSAVFDTGVHIELPCLTVHNGLFAEIWKTAGFVKGKSGLNFKHDLVTDGTIDVDYTGSVSVKLYNLGKTDYHVKRGDKIAQLCIVPVLTPELNLVTELKETQRGAGGFGSTGR